MMAQRTLGISEVKSVIPAASGVALIDNNTPLLDHSELFSDGVHPSAEGAAVIAGTVAAALRSESTTSGSISAD